MGISFCLKSSISDEGGVCMLKDEEKAMLEFESQDFSFVAVKDGKVISSVGIGVKPIIEQLRENKQGLEGYSIVDKVIGKAAAMLLVLSKVKHVYGKIMSDTAIEVLKRHEIGYAYDERVAYIENRTHTGMCPLEDCVKDCEDVQEAFGFIEERIKELMKK